MLGADRPGRAGAGERPPGPPAGPRSGSRRARPAPFIVGVGRSGTTLLRLMLDSHPELAIPPETGFAPEVVRACRAGAARRRRAGRAAARAAQLGRLRPRRGRARAPLRGLRGRLDGGARSARALRPLRGGPGKPRWGDKTPAYVKRMPMISKALPEARFVHVIRDGRDVALSRARRRACREPAPPERAAETWRKRILRAREAAERLDHYLEVRYEDLVTRHRGHAAPGRRARRAGLGRRDAPLLRARARAPGGDLARPPRERAKAEPARGRARRSARPGEGAAEARSHRRLERAMPASRPRRLRARRGRPARRARIRGRGPARFAASATRRRARRRRSSSA